ncbi:WXG100 family type VII secretion target [Nocardia lijiangensis]|uniref:WXG100 family type VII secretion target n=1 Tax=Nocardia lijiangensis TaxID=299618 RepID=UPI00082FE35B|nr:WXG100 family type VII secretion target [Nocardia lijiangensis]
MTGTPGESLSVVPDEVRALGNYVYSIADALRTALDSAGRDVSTLTSGGWVGVAANGFSEGWGEVQSGGQRIFTALTTMAEKLGVTAETYVQRDQSTAGEYIRLDLP